MKCLLGACSILVLAGLSATVGAQDYPNKPIRVVVPFAPGGGADVIARVVSQPLSDALGQLLVIDNRAGAGGTIGAGLVAKATPDGYTLLVASTGPNAVAPSIYARLPYDPLRSFSPISRLSIQPAIIVVNPSLGAKTVSDLIALAKSRPGQLHFGSPGVGTTSHLGGELFKSLARVDLVHVPYKTGPLAQTDLISGRLSVIFDNIAPLYPQVKSGKLLALAVASNKRTSLLPELATAAEAGLPGFEYSIWFGLSAPAGAPKSVITLWSRKVSQVLESAKMKEALRSLSAEPSGSTPWEFHAFIAAEIDKWSKVARFAGIKPQ